MTSVGVSPGKEIQSRPAAGVFASPQRQKFGLAILLVVATVALYYPANGHPFVNFDDNLYVTENLHVTAGLTWQTVKWAFTTFDQGNWHPVTWLSHAADCQLYGLNPAGHHQTNLVLHVCNVVLLFWVLQQATGYVGRSAMVAALFALHPINVETVVWISERKNLLSMTFFLLALGAYRRYVQKPDVARYGLVALLYALGPDGQASGHNLSLRSFAVGLLALAADVGCRAGVAQGNGNCWLNWKEHFPAYRRKDPAVRPFRS